MEDVGDQASNRLNTTASGITLMAIFTPAFALWTVFEWLAPAAVLVALTLVWSIYLASTAYRLLQLSSQRPQEPNEYDSQSTRVIVTVGLTQAGLITAVLIGFTLLDLLRWFLPVIALLVAPFFFLMPAHSQQPGGKQLGRAMLIVAAVGFVLAALGIDWQIIVGITGLGGALVAGYAGFLLLRMGRQLLAE